METLRQEAEEDAPRGCARGAADPAAARRHAAARAAALRVLLQHQRTFGELGSDSSADASCGSRLDCVEMLTRKYLVMLANRENCGEGVSHHHFSHHDHHHHHHHATQPLICRADPRWCKANAANSGSAHAKTPPRKKPSLAPSENMCIPSPTAVRPLIPRPTCHNPHATTATHSAANSLSLSLSLYLSPSFFLLRAQQLWVKARCRLRPPRHALDRPRYCQWALRGHKPADIRAQPRQAPPPGRGQSTSQTMALPWWGTQPEVHSPNP